MNPQGSPPAERAPGRSQGTSACLQAPAQDCSQLALKGTDELPAGARHVPAFLPWRVNKIHARLCDQVAAEYGARAVKLIGQRGREREQQVAAVLADEWRRLARWVWVHAESGVGRFWPSQAALVSQYGAFGIREFDFGPVVIRQRRVLLGDLAGLLSFLTTPTTAATATVGA